MTFGDPQMNSGSLPEHHPEHPKVPSAALEPLEARSSAPVHRNRPSPAFLQKVLLGLGSGGWGHLLIPPPIQIQTLVAGGMLSTTLSGLAYLLKF